MRVISGQYTGTGATMAAQATGLAHIDFLWIKAVSAQRGVIWNNAYLTANQVHEADTNAAMAVPTGFSVNVPEGSFVPGTDGRININTVVTHWIAIQTDGLDAAVGSYLGDGVDNREIDWLGWTPTWALIIADGQVAAVRSGSDVGDISFPLDGSAGGANRIQAMRTTGIQLGSDSRVNGNGTRYYYFVLKDVAGIAKVITYTGNGVGGLGVTGAGFAPDNIILRGNSANRGVTRFKGESGTSGSMQISAASEASQQITSKDSDGFTYGTSPVVIQAVLYSALCLKDGSSLPAVAVD